MPEPCDGTRRRNDGTPRRTLGSGPSGAWRTPRHMPRRCQSKRANRRCVLAAPSHGGRGKLADGCAIHVQRDAARHHLHVLLLQACRRAVIARGGALIAGLDARGVLLVGHVLAPSMKPEIRLPQKARRAPTATPAKDPNTSAPTPACAVRETSVDASGRCCSRSGQNYIWLGSEAKRLGTRLR